MITLKETDLTGKFNEYASFVLKNGFVFDLENKVAIKACIEIFEKNETGSIIVGNPGSGKTLFFEIMQKILHPKDERVFSKFNTLDVVLQFNNKEVGHGVFSKWQDKNLFFDDLGTEDKGSFYGEKVEVFEKFIQFRYDLFRSKKLKTHFTTNLSKNQLNDRYGLRCASRLNEMCQKNLLGEKMDYTDRRVYRNFIELPPVFHAPILTKWDIEWHKNYQAMKNNNTVLDIKKNSDNLRQKIGLIQQKNEVNREKTEHEILMQDIFKEFDQLHRDKPYDKTETIRTIPYLDKNLTQDEFLFIRLEEMEKL